MNVFVKRSRVGFEFYLSFFFIPPSQICQPFSSIVTTCQSRSLPPILLRWAWPSSCYFISFETSGSICSLFGSPIRFGLRDRPWCVLFMAGTGGTGDNGFGAFYWRKLNNTENGITVCSFETSPIMLFISNVLMGTLEGFWSTLCVVQSRYRRNWRIQTFKHDILSHW